MNQPVTHAGLGSARSVVQPDWITRHGCYGRLARSQPALQLNSLRVQALGGQLLVRNFSLPARPASASSTGRSRDSTMVRSCNRAHRSMSGSSRGRLRASRTRRRQAAARASPSDVAGHSLSQPHSYRPDYATNYISRLADKGATPRKSTAFMPHRGVPRERKFRAGCGVKRCFWSECLKEAQ